MNGFYITKDIELLSEGQYQAHIIINENHPIFQGHFPNNPVVPGVCMMQIIKDLTEKIVEKKLVLSSASNIKFMSLINPLVNKELKININLDADDERVKVKNTSMFIDDTIALKMNLNYDYETL